MPETIRSLSVTGTVAADSNEAMLLLSEKLDGHDTFLTCQLQFGQTPPVTARILTFDDVTVLHLLDQPPVPLKETWSATLHLPHGWRTWQVPHDLTIAATTAHRDLGALDEAELRYALTFLSEASTDAIRRGRIEAIISALPQSDGTI